MSVNDTSIDENNLVEECFGISSAIQGALKDAGDAKDILEDKKSYVKHIRSKTWLAYRTGQKTIEGFDGKMTDKMVDNATECDPEVKEAVDAYNVALKEYGIHSDYATAMDAKKKALEIITRYALSGWFSDLKIASLDSISKFADGIPDENTDTLSEREALRAKRRNRS